jgi:CheY-like chemotaxis protein
MKVNEDLRCRVVLLVADDDDDDQFLIREAFEASTLPCQLRFVNDGEQLMDYLNHHGQFVDKHESPRPDLILLDLNMPRKDGREVLKELKSDPAMCNIPIVILTTSDSKEDVDLAYKLGANSFVIKPSSSDSFGDLMNSLIHYWGEVVRLPSQKDEVVIG